MNRIRNLLRLACALGLLAAAGQAVAQNTVSNTPTTPPKSDRPGFRQFPPLPRPGGERPPLPEDVQDLVGQFNAQRDAWLLERQAYLERLRNAAETEREAILAELRTASQEYREAQRELARQIREELRALRDERRGTRPGG